MENDKINKFVMVHLKKKEKRKKEKVFVAVFMSFLNSFH